MNRADAAQYLAFLVLVTVATKPLGGYLHRVFTRQRTFLDPVCLPIERLIAGLCRVDPAEEMTAPRYIGCFLIFGGLSALLVYLILRLQPFLPWFFPAYQTTAMSPDLAFNTALSFTTTTTWQAYAGENTMSYFSQMAALTTGNFLGGASGLATGIAFIRGFTRERSDGLGNFWGDVMRAMLWVLLPGALVGAVVLVWQGVPMNFNGYTVATNLEHQAQVIAQGPVAALEIIKNLGTNGGGFFNANGAHPFANPTPFTNFLGMLAIVLVPAALTNTFGRMAGQPRQGWMLYAAMVMLFVAGTGAVHWSETNGGAHRRLGSTAQGPMVAGGNMEGKEARFGVGGSTLTAVVTSNTATGSYNAMADSFTALGGGVLLLNLLLGEIVFGGLGTGISSLVMAALVVVFVAGLMVGRTPEYLGKRIGPRETKLIMFYALIMPATVTLLAGVAVSTTAGLSSLTVNHGPHGLTTILVAYASSFANNGLSFAGLNANTVFYNGTTAVAMMLGRYLLTIPALLLAGQVAAQRRTQSTAGTLPTDSFLFLAMLVGMVLIFAGLSYLPALTLGPIAEHVFRFSR
jgi:potassium-transporting ATPase potassium-binding subunit